MLSPHVESLLLEWDDPSAVPHGELMFWQAHLCIRVYRLQGDRTLEDALESDGGSDVDDDRASSGCSMWALPFRSFEGLWENLAYDERIKPSLLGYARTAMLFSSRGVDSNLVGCNRVIFAHGPPGTGKTSLCRSLAQKLSIRLSREFPRASLVEVHSHSLFSKWFSESGKIVGRLFSRIQEMAKDPRTLVFVLIDEVESIAGARDLALSRSEPSDAVRVVNALLTKLDAMRQLPNVLVLATSNISRAIDVAFIDRADVKLFVGPPAAPARQRILAGAVAELSRRGLVRDEDVAAPATGDDSGTAHDAARRKHAADDRIASLVALTEGFSGRMLRKLPFLAYVPFGASSAELPTSELFIESLYRTAERELSAVGEIPMQVEPAARAEQPSAKK